MKADRLMRVNGRKNLWLLRNTNQLYDNAVKSFNERTNTLLPYNPAFQPTRDREENQAPLRTLTTSQRQGRTPTTDYPRNHKQMAEQAANANAQNLLNTVMQANRRRSMSFSAGGLRMYGRNRGLLGSSPRSSSTLLGTGKNNSSKRGRNRRSSATEAAEMDLDQFDVSVLRGRSMSLPARTSMGGLGMGYTMGRQRETSREPQPSYRHHLNTIERTKRKLEHNKGNDDSEQPLMVVDKALKQRLAVKYEQAPEPGLFGGGTGLVDNRRLTSRAPSSFAAGGSEQLRFHTLGERIRRFEVMQFADGPAKFPAFNRRQDYGRSGRTQQQQQQQLIIKNVPKQEPNLVSRNHRQRALNHLTDPEQQRTEQKTMMMMAMMKRKAIQADSNVMPLGPLGPLTPNWRPQQQQQQQQQQEQPYNTKQQQQQQQQQYDDAFPPTPKHTKKLKKAKSKKSVKSVKDEPKRVPLAMLQSAAVNKVARSSHAVHMRDSNASRRQQLLPRRLAEQLQPDHTVKAQQATPRQSLKLPQQPQTLKGVNHLLAASASQVSACKRAFKTRQQVLQAEMMHMHTRQESEQQRQKHKQQQVKQKRQQEQQLQRKQEQHNRHKQQQQQQEQLQQKQKLHLLRIQQLPLGAKKETKPPAKTQQQQQQQQKLPQVKSAQTQKKQKQQQQQQLKNKKPTANPQQQQSATAAIPLPVEASQKRRRLNLPAYKATVVAAAAARGHAVTAMEQSLSTSFQRMQQQQLHQQLRQRRQQPYESLWRHTY